MKKFILQILLFIFPVGFWYVFSNDILPVTTWTMRTWEATRVRNVYLPTAFGPYYPYYKVRMYEQGDMAHHTAFSVLKDVTWENDELGYRNRPKTKDSIIDILVLGDSFISGSSLDQDQTLSEQLRLRTGKNVYQISPGGLEEFDVLMHLKYLNKPKVIIYEMVERNLNSLNTFSKYYVSEKELRRIKLSEHYLLSQSFIMYDRLRKNASLLYMKARINRQKGPGKQSKINDKFFFFQGKDQMQADRFNYNKIISSLKSYKAYCDSLGIKFVFFSCPDKETVYYEYVPFEKQSVTLLKLDSLLNQNHINTVNSLELFNRNKPRYLLYNYDDTHWNAYGVSVIAAELVKKHLRKL